MTTASSRGAALLALVQTWEDAAEVLDGMQATSHYTHWGAMAAANRSHAQQVRDVLAHRPIETPSRGDA